jgi:hypothetical protein
MISSFDIEHQQEITIQESGVQLLKKNLIENGSVQVPVFRKT